MHRSFIITGQVRGSCWWSLAAEPIFGTPETLFYALRICFLFRMLFILRICQLPFTIYIMSETLSLHSRPYICHRASTKKELVQQKKTILTPHCEPLAIDRTFAGWHTSSVVADITNKDTHSLRHSTDPSCPQEEDPVLGICTA